jgi:guanine deaminase
MEESFMRRAIALSVEGVAAGGGPFGAVVVKDGRIIGEGRNNVVPGQDPTQHAEVVAIRAACAAVGTHDLGGATIYTSCEPCPMCLGAIWWSRIGTIVHGNTRADAAAIGFDDEALYQEMARPVTARTLPLRRLMGAEALAAFQLWAEKPDKVPY